MTKQKQCMDFYGERLKVGDVVIPIIEEALLIGIGGNISKIEYSESYDNYYSEDTIEGILEGKYEVKMAEVHTENESTDSNGNTHKNTIFHGMFGYIVK